MIYYATKVLISAVLVVVISEVSKRSTSSGGILASLPVVSVLAIGWLYHDTHDLVKLAAFARSTFCYVLPSLAFFFIFPASLQAGRGFGFSLTIALVGTATGYLAMALFLNKVGVKL